jgi:hypothetical protein
MPLDRLVPDRRQLMQDLASRLGGQWACEAGPYRADYLNGPEHERLSCLLTGRNLRIEGVLPKVGRYMQIKHIINVTTAKRPRVIAAEIERRLLPAYRADLAPARERKAAEDSARARTLALCAEISQHLGHAWIRDTDGSGRPRLATDCHYPYRHQAEFRFDHYEESVDLHLRRADPELARAISRLIAAHHGHPRS